MSNEAEVPPQRIWIQNDFSFFELNGNGTYYRTPDENSIPYVPASALDGVWEKAIVVAREVADSHRQLALEKGSSASIANAGLSLGAWKVMHALQAARDTARGKGATSGKVGHE